MLTLIKKFVSPTDFQKLTIINKVVESKSRNPKATQNDLSKELNISKRTLSRVAFDTGYKFRGICDNKNSNPKTEECNICKNMFTKRGLSTHKRLKHSEKTTVLRKNTRHKNTRPEGGCQRHKKEETGFGEKLSDYREVTIEEVMNS